jgi:predicted dehydrogenase
MHRREFLRNGAIALTTAATRPLFAFQGANDRVRMAVIGMGSRSGRVFDSFTRFNDVQFAMGCEVSESKLQGFQGNRPLSQALDVVGDYRRVLDRNDIDAVLVGTPDFSHARITADALAAGKHVFVEKPLAQSLADAEAVVADARDSGRTLMVGHLLEYHPGVERLKELVDSDELGKVHYIYGNRLNLGKLRADENALWSLGAHDISVVLHLAGEEPYELSARGEAYKQRGIEDVVFGFLRFPSGLAAHLHLSWLDPHKERRFTVVGSKRMATFDDMALERKLTVYDKGFDEDYSSYGEYIARSGDIYSPRISNEEPLRIECRHFLDCVRTGTEPRSGAASGLRAVRVLEALQRSLESGGTPQRLQTAGPVA